MRNPWKTAFTLLLSINVLIVVLGLGFAKAETDRSVLYAYVNQSITDYENGDAPYIDFSALGLFAWDKLYVLGPYSPCEFMSGGRSSLAALVYSIECQLRGYASYETGSILLFEVDAWRIRYVLYDGLEPGTIAADGFDYGNARFILDENRNLLWVPSK